MATELSRNAVIKTYARWAPVYDVVFGSVFENARRMAVEASERVGGRILEVGVGTGISLPYYSARSRVVGIDISEPMLKVARRAGDRRGAGARRAARADGCGEPGISGGLLRRRRRPVRGQHRAPSRDRARRVPARAAAGRGAGDRQPGGCRRAARARRSSTCSSRSRNGSAGGPSFRGRASSAGPAARRRPISSSAARCRRSAISRSSASASSVPGATPSNIAASAPREAASGRGHAGGSTQSPDSAHDNGGHHARFLQRARNPAVGRPSLLPSQPHQPVAASPQRHQLSRRLRPAVRRSAGGGAGRLADRHDDTAGRATSSSSQGLRPRQPGDARVQGGREGRLQPAAQGRADGHLGAVPGRAAAGADAVRPARRRTATGWATRATSA